MRRVYMKKILFLTLGGGSKVPFLSDPILREKNREERRSLIRQRLDEVVPYKYGLVKYHFPDSDMEYIETEFVAEPLIRKERPDYVYIMGTAKSVWIDLYRKYSDTTIDQKAEDITNLAELHELSHIVEGYENEPLRKISERLEKIMVPAVKNRLLSGCPQDVVVKTILLHEGINEEQLQDNYEILAEIWRTLDKRETYDVSFDITHLFRSLPIYNLSLLEYQRQIADYDITISHVYYGNFEAMKDNVAPIIDLSDLVKVMDLSRGVSEFRELGYSMTLVNQIPEDMGELRDSLGEFYWAVQMNDVTTICETTGRILALLNERKGVGGRYADLRKMLRAALSDILGGEPERYNQLNTPEKVYTLKLLLAKWHRKKKRYAGALSSALESLRVKFNYCYQCFSLNKPADHEYSKTLYSFNNIQSAEEKILQRCVNKDKSGEFSAFAEVYSKAKDIRNSVAHYAVEEKEYTVTSDVAKEYADKIISFADRLYGEGEFAQSFYALFGASSKEARSNPEEDCGRTEDRNENISRVNGQRNIKNSGYPRPAVYIGAESGDSHAAKDFRERFGDRNRLLRLDPDMYDRLFVSGSKQFAKWTEQAYLLTEYLTEKIKNYPRADIGNTPLFISLPPEKAVIVALILAREGKAYNVWFAESGGQFTRIPTYQRGEEKAFASGVPFVSLSRDAKNRLSAKAEEYFKYELCSFE